MLSAFDFIFQVFSASGNWFMQIMERLDALMIWISAIIIATTYRFVFSPLFGQAHSDTVKRTYNALKGRKDK